MPLFLRMGFIYIYISGLPTKGDQARLRGDERGEKLGERNLIAFRQILPKILFAVCILSVTIMTYLKKCIGIIFLNTKQYSPGLSPRIIPPLYPVSY